MPKLSELKESLQNKLLESYQEEYKELTGNWTSLESKATTVITVSGIFIGAVFAYIRESKSDTPNYEKGFLVFSISCLVVSVAMAVFALNVRKIKKSPFGKNTEELSEGYEEISKKEDFERFSQGFANDQLKSWREVRNNIATENEKKAGFIWKANIFLMIAILSVAVLSIFKLSFLINLK
jgi:hypothetical protein